VRTIKRNTESHRPNEQAAADVMFDSLVRLEEKLLALQTLDDFDREILAIIAPALNAGRGMSKSHSADLEVQP
jgi:hypothetical protein